MSELSTENVKYLIRWSDQGLPMKGNAMREVHALESRVEELENELNQANEQATSKSNCNIPLVSKMSLSDKEIEDHIWEEFPEGLNCEDQENNTDAYKRYLQIVNIVKDMRNIP